MTAEINLSFTLHNVRLGVRGCICSRRWDLRFLSWPKKLHTPLFPDRLAGLFVWFWASQKTPMLCCYRCRYRCVAEVERCRDLAINRRSALCLWKKFKLSGVWAGFWRGGPQLPPGGDPTRVAPFPENEQRDAHPFVGLPRITNF
jgi:hypothetical protein